MVLAAGRGERLRPLTLRTPKPLLVAGGRTLLERVLERVARAGVREVVVNVAHLGEQIVGRFGDGRALGLAIAWSREPEPLESAGGIAAARALLGPEPFLLVNSDVACDVDLGRLARHRLQGALAHLVLVPNPAHHPQGDFTLEGGRIGVAGMPRYTYAGIGVLDPRIVADVAPGTKAPLAPRLAEAARRGLATGELYQGRWLDVGTPERLAALEALLREDRSAP
jgi:MurNAc alpha-1-phosphate uridylyltransferase